MDTTGRTSLSHLHRVIHWRPATRVVAKGAQPQSGLGRTAFGRCRGSARAERLPGRRSGAQRLALGRYGGAGSGISISSTIYRQGTRTIENFRKQSKAHVRRLSANGCDRTIGAFEFARARSICASNLIIFSITFAYTQQVEYIRGAVATTFWSSKQSCQRHHSNSTRGLRKFWRN